MASHFSFDAIGTRWLIDISDELSLPLEEQLLAEIMARIDLFDKAYSRFRKDSLVTKMSEEAGKYMLPEDSGLLMDTYKRLYDSTGGLMTPLIGQALVDAGYDAEYSLVQAKELSRPRAWEDVISFQFPELTLHEPALLDFGAAGKGYLVDLVGEVIARYASSYCIDAGSDILHKSSSNQPIRIGLEHPDDFSKVIGVAEISNESFCASAGNRRAWGKFHHIIDPDKLSSPRHILATWVSADTTLLADALATALFFVPGKKLQEEYEFEYVVLNADYSAERSEGFPGEVFSG